MNREDQIYEKIMRPEYEKKREAFFEAASPIIHRMVELRMVYTSPWMVVRDGVVDDSGETWIDPKALELYGQYEETLRLLQRTIFTEK